MSQTILRTVVDDLIMDFKQQFDDKQLQIVVSAHL
jgi:hypothetical protein